MNVRLLRKEGIRTVKKRALSLLLAFCMALSLVSMAAQAEEVAQAAETEESNLGDNAVTLLDSGDAMTRGEWMHELVVLFGLSLEKSEYPDIYFPDIEGTTYFDDIMIATNGVSQKRRTKSKA